MLKYLRGLRSLCSSAAYNQGQLKLIFLHHFMQFTIKGSYNQVNTVCEFFVWEIVLESDKEPLILFICWNVDVWSFLPCRIYSVHACHCIVLFLSFCTNTIRDVLKSKWLFLIGTRNEWQQRRNLDELIIIFNTFFIDMILFQMHRNTQSLSSNCINLLSSKTFIAQNILYKEFWFML